MDSALPIEKRRGLGVILAPRRFLVALVASGVMGFLLSHGFVATPKYVVMGRAMLVSIACLVAFGIFEQWPARLPQWMARWALQVLAVAFVVPWAVAAIYIGTTAPDQQPFWHDYLRRNGFMMLTMGGLLVGPWVAVAGLFRQKEFAARSQALAFELERSRLERNALDARLRALQARVEPHFLFNTLANVRELVVSGSPQAATLLDSLIAYLRAAVPRLNEPLATLGQELQLVRAYLELMHTRMPDRLQFDLQVDGAALELRCPPTTLLTLVENAVRHGIDPSEEGGRIDVRVEVVGELCRVQVRDSGRGLSSANVGLGSGLATLRERLELAFGGNARLRLAASLPRGAVAEVEFPAQRAVA
jgi:hypothetical protein